MPNKDSFTFSDKLRKSKSEPLSKRLPSIVGGQNKQKRTLVQRAQRDLPFILVAALALLLLPFLSRTGSDDIASTGDLAWNTLADAPSFAEGGGADIMPAGAMQDPLDLILRPRSAVETSGVTMGSEAKKSAYGSGDGEGSGYRSSRYSASGSSSSRPDYNTRKSYDEQYTKTTTKTPATAKYGTKTRPAVRQSIVRKGTEINRALRISQMNPNKGGANVSHTLPIGQGPTRTPGNYYNPGVRPIALQPMEARGGVGRGMTGENLYAEATRSIGEMNAGGPAKANLLAAQMRDVDGKLSPQAPGFGGPGSGASVRPGAGGGGPGNTNGYSIGKPWWWDMMQSRSQKMWELLYYKPREIWYTNMYNYASQLMNCLFTGNKDGDVSTMFGKKAGDAEVVCIGNPNWDISLDDYLAKGKIQSKSEDGKSTSERVTVSEDKWYSQCESYPGAKASVEQGSRKSALRVRMECVGLDYKRMKSWFNANLYGANCSYVNNDPMEFTYSVTKNGKNKGRLERKAVIALIAKVNTEGAKAEKRHIFESSTEEYKALQGKEIVLYTEMGTKFKKTEAELRQMYDPDKCTLTKIVGFVPKANADIVRKNVGQANLDDENANVNNWARFRGQVIAAQKVCKGTNTSADVHPLTLDNVYDIADFVTQGGGALGVGDGILSRGAKKGSLQICSIWDKKPEFTKYINGIECHDCCQEGIEILGDTSFKATIKNSADKHVYAVLVDQIDQRTKAKVAYMVDFKADGSNGSRNCYNGTDCDYEFNVNAAALGVDSHLADPGAASSGTARGSGLIFWIVTQGNAVFKVRQGQEIADNTHMITVDDLIESSQSLISEICRYKWCNDIGNCDLTRRPTPNDYCVEDDKVYIAHKIKVNSDEYVYMKEESSGPQEIPPDGRPQCEQLCVDSEGNVHKCNSDGKPEEDIKCPFSEIPSAYQGIIKPCPSCCSYTLNGETKTYKSVNVNGKFYITDATPGYCESTTNQCTPAAWSEESGKFIVYNMINGHAYDPNRLKLVPTGPQFTTALHTGTPSTPEIILGDDLFTYVELFRETIKGQSELNQSGPTMFPLFPKLELPSRQDIIDVCKIRLKFNYQNASYSPQPPVEYNAAAQAIAECINKIKALKQSGTLASDEDYSTLYFHGFASYGGNEYKNCDGGKQTGPQCNVALSEDRNLYVMDKIAEILGREFSIGKESATTSRYGNPKDLNGFTNTNDNNPCKPSSPCMPFPYRYGKKYNDIPGSDIIFKSVPHGEDDATWTSKETMSPDEIETIHAPDRFIVIDIKPSVTRAEVKDDSSYKEYSNDGYNINSPSRTPGNQRR